MISLMPMVQRPNDDTDDGAAMNGGRRPTVVAAPVSTSPELSARPRFTRHVRSRLTARSPSTPRASSTKRRCPSPNPPPHGSTGPRRKPCLNADPSHRGAPTESDVRFGGRASPRGRCWRTAVDPKRTFNARPAACCCCAAARLSYHGVVYRHIAQLLL